MYDAAGKDTLEISVASVRPRGMIALYGSASGPTPPFDLARLGPNSLFLTRASLGAYIATTEELRERARLTFAAYKAGQFKLDHITQFALSDAASAHRAIESRTTMGPIVLTA